MKYLIKTPMKFTVLPNQGIELTVDDQYITPQYILSYTKLDGTKKKYSLLEISEMTNTHLKAVTNKGYRTFILNRVEKMVPINN